MSEQSKRSEKKKRRHKAISQMLLLDVLADPRTRPIILYAVVAITVGAALYHWLEGWAWLDSFYFVVITLTTIGYGDFSPTTPITKLITIFYGVNGIVIFMMIFDVVRSLRRWDLNREDRFDESEETNE